MVKKFVTEPLDENRFKEKQNGKLWYKTKTRVLYADTDAAGVVYHANYLRYFEIGRAELLRSSGASYKEIEDRKIFHPIVRVEMDFRNPARYDEELDIFVRPYSLETVKFTIEYKVFPVNGEKPLVEGLTVHCCTVEGKRPCEVDDISKKLFKLYNVG